MDAESYREESRRRWEESAAGWERRRGAMQLAAEPVSMWMVEELRLQPGHTVLELAGGPGDTGLLAAEVVQPAGKVILTDAADAMVEAAMRRAQELGITNVEGRRMDAEWIDLPTASVDGVLCRWGYMLLADPETAFRETRRVLRSGGRVALAAWTQAADNQWMWAITDSLTELGFAPAPDPDEPGPMAFAEPGTIERLLGDAGFDDIHVEAVDFTFPFASSDDHWDHQTDLSARLKGALQKLSPADHTRLRDEVDRRLARFTAPDGTLAIPARTWVAAASA